MQSCTNRSGHLESTVSHFTEIQVQIVVPSLVVFLFVFLLCPLSKTLIAPLVILGSFGVSTGGKVRSEDCETRSVRAFVFNWFYTRGRVEGKDCKTGSVRAFVFNWFYTGGKVGSEDCETGSVRASVFGSGFNAEEGSVPACVFSTRGRVEGEDCNKGSASAFVFYTWGRVEGEDSKTTPVRAFVTVLNAETRSLSASSFSGVYTGGRVEGEDAETGSVRSYNSSFNAETRSLSASVFSTKGRVEGKD